MTIHYPHTGNMFMQVLQADITTDASAGLKNLTVTLPKAGRFVTGQVTIGDVAGNAYDQLQSLGLVDAANNQLVYGTEYSSIKIRVEQLDATARLVEFYICLFMI